MNDPPSPSPAQGDQNASTSWNEYTTAEAGPSNTTRNTEATTGSATTTSSYYQSMTMPMQTGSVFSGNQSYYDYSVWQRSWSQAGAYPYPPYYTQAQQRQAGMGTAAAAFPSYQAQTFGTFPQVPYLQYSLPQAEDAKPKKPPSPSPSPSPPPRETYRHWDQVIRSFLNSLGLLQAAAGLEADILVMNPEWEQKKVPEALSQLVKDVLSLRTPKEDKETDDGDVDDRPLDERKLDYVHLAQDVTPRTPSMINGMISDFLAKNRARNDASNRSEFVYTLAEKRRRLMDSAVKSDGSESVTTAAAKMEPSPSCARVDARPINRDEQIKYDIAKNEDGPLSRTMLSSHQPQSSSGQKEKGKAKDSGSPTGREDVANPPSDKHPGIDERLRNIETHFAIRYVPSPPRGLLDRLQFLENHIFQLEKEFPPWAALHFNQPNRGVSNSTFPSFLLSLLIRVWDAPRLQWPPPPRSTPVIVPPQMRSKEETPQTSATTSAEDPPVRGTRQKQSSLHRAVLERLEVQQAMSDLGRKTESSRDSRT